MLIDFRETAAMDFIEQIERALNTKPGVSKSGLAKVLKKHQNVVTNILSRNRRVQLDEEPKIRKYLGLGSIPIKGLVGASAGDEVNYFGTGDDPGENAPTIPNAGPDTVAVEIRGDSLGKAFNGWLAYYDDRRAPITEDLIGWLCVVGLEGGTIVAKIPKKARTAGRYHLLPNAGGDVIPDAKIEWAARIINLQPKL